MIELDSEQGNKLGFTSDRFSTSSYLYDDGSNYIIISAISSKQKGNFFALTQNIINLGYGIKIPSPMGKMKEIVRNNGYRQTWEDDDLTGEIEIWVLDPPLITNY